MDRATKGFHQAFTGRRYGTAQRGYRAVQLSSAGEAGFAGSTGGTAWQVACAIWAVLIVFGDFLFATGDRMDANCICSWGNN